MVTGFFCGWPVLCGAWQAPVFTLLAAIGYAMHLLFFISRRFTGAVFFMLVECAIVHGLFFAWTVTDFCHATVNYVQKVAKDRDRRYEYTNPNDGVKAALLGLAVALGSVPAFLDDKDQDHSTNGDDNDQQGDSIVQSTWQQPAVKYSPGRSILWQSSLASKGLLTAACRWLGRRLTPRPLMTYIIFPQRRLPLRYPSHSSARVRSSQRPCQKRARADCKLLHSTIGPYSRNSHWFHGLCPPHPVFSLFDPVWPKDDLHEPRPLRDCAPRYRSPAQR